MKNLRMPPFLQDVLGAEQPVATLYLVAGFGLSIPALLLLLDPVLFGDLPLWRSGLALVLIADIAAGCVANFTPATSAFYAQRPSNRKVFIAIHLHIVILALLLDEAIVQTVVVWACTIAGTILVNGLARNPLQPVTGGFILAAGLVGTSLFATTSPVMLAVMQLFLLKLVYAFAVDHYGHAREMEASAAPLQGMAVKRESPHD